MHTSKWFQVVGALGLLLLNPVQSFAHVALVNSEPAADSSVVAAPENLTLRFTEEVRLLKAAVSVKDGKELDIRFAPVTAAAKQFSVPLPKLEQGMYSVSWTVMGDDGHRMDQSFSFTVDHGAAQAGAMPHGHAEPHGDAAHAENHGAHQ